VPPSVARFELLKELGSGGFGTVYQAWDREGSRLVALKLAHEARASALRRFKAEFLTLCDASHEHVARLYELHQEGGAWFFTMEYVDGVPLDAWLLPELESWPLATRPGRPVARALDGGGRATDPTLSWKTEPDANAPVHVPDVERPRAAVQDLDKVRAIFRQVVEALAWLHATGHVHRDVKPSNVLVTPEGIVKLVDFGLVTRMRTGEDGPDPLAGTPPFMAPELVLGQRATPAVDWYALGVMLHLVLTGSLPWFARPDLSGPSATYRPSALCDGIPEDLDALCGALLSADPADRPGAVSILAALGLPPGGPPAPALTPELAPAPLPPVVLPASRASTSELGPTNIMLRSRCLARGSVRFAALDGAIDGLAAMLAARMPRDVERLLPADKVERAAMMALFPSLQDSALEVEPAPALALAELERTGLAGLARLFANVRAHRPVTIVVDDAQWIDADSVRAVRAMSSAGLEWVLVTSDKRAPAPHRDALLAHLGAAAQHCVRQVD